MQRRAPGVLPLDMAKTGIDYLCMPGHKGLYGPMGTGLLLCADGEKIRPLLEGGTGSLSAHLYQPPILPDKLESGTAIRQGFSLFPPALVLFKRLVLTKLHSMSFL